MVTTYLVTSPEMTKLLSPPANQKRRHKRARHEVEQSWLGDGHEKESQKREHETDAVRCNSAIEILRNCSKRAACFCHNYYKTVEKECNGVIRYVTQHQVDSLSSLLVVLISK